MQANYHSKKYHNTTMCNWTNLKMSVEAAACCSKAAWLWSSQRFAVVSHQEDATGRAVFALLPTRYGKSLCYGCLPLVLDFLHHPTEYSIVCVITPRGSNFNQHSSQQAMYKTVAIKKIQQTNCARALYIDHTSKLH